MSPLFPLIIPFSPMPSLGLRSGRAHLQTWLTACSIVSSHLKKKAIVTCDSNLIVAKGGKVAAVAGATPVRQLLPEKVKLDGVKTERIKMRYGPYKVPNMKVTNILGEEGALWNYADPIADKPCGEAGECTIIGMVSGLEYPDGKNANIDSGLWLHHVR
jgi:hypothetical protein